MLEAPEMARFRVDELLHARGMSQSDLARASGVSLFTVHAIVNNKTIQVRLDTLEKLARALGVAPGELIASDKKRAKGK